ncbi:MAG: methyltransferase [Candidatus Woesearchaeota archaeon]|nr:MAG: methyltransferase [Candidatus Woesearchaeota archaeon]
MKKFSSLYSKYYDLLYKDKGYSEESEYIINLIEKFKSNSKSILDLGCGTGRHAELISDNGYIVYGVDASEEMLKVADQRRKGKESNLKFIHSRIQDLRIDEKFDVVTALFHVLSYQSSNEDLLKSFEIVKKHLTKDGIFIFDFWYGTAVLTEMPEIRVKRLEDESVRIIRIAEPFIHYDKNTVDVNYTLLIIDKRTNETTELHEQHKMRYFFDPELELICEMFGFKILSKYKWFTFDNPDSKSWSVVWILKN